ncbi:lantibiotic dehydratase [Hufsiella ginkgonis]|uniref:Lantibiotic dehydratase n=1 Tax=Hufsiella ginkgonis TaxID=2695274 RepID=A0A7K1XYK8_9SPHI|nr:lantibiotic dehydratase [Hufsiella ginkgonis]MXV16081.1 hypothetical protein [Hufsiella ginkgonis]
MNYHFLPELVMRSPAISYANYSLAYAEALCRTDFFKSAILLASESFYQELEKNRFEMSLLNSAQRITLMKYVNRMCFRPTPFGLFSGFSVLQWGVQEGPVTIKAPFGKVHLHADHGLSAALGKILKSRLKPFAQYRVNPTIYTPGQEYRYLFAQKVQGKSRYQFNLDSFARNPLIRGILSFCSGYRTTREITAFICEKAGCSEQEAMDYIDSLAAKQVLESADDQPITGDSYEISLLVKCRDLGIAGSDIDNIQTLTTLLYGHHLPDKALTARIADKLSASGLDVPGKGCFYSAYEHQVMNPVLDQSILASVKSGIRCLDRLLPAPEINPAIERFKEAFQQKFEGRTIPLLLALDPEAGVGYGNSHAVGNTDELLETVQFVKEDPAPEKLHWTATHRLLFQKWKQYPNAENEPATIQLSDADLMQLPEPTSPYPAGISVLFRVFDDKVLIEQAGGATSTALIGRFSLFSEEVACVAKTLARQEQAANPGIAFAEIVHLCDTHADNINRRTVIHELEIPVLCQSALPAQQQLLLNDLFVAVKNNELVLYSGRLKKRVIPRLSTAFNYLRNDLPLFRFLCDLQFQGLKSSFSLDLTRLFPGLGFYPRIEYRQSILHLAAWHFKAAQLTGDQPGFFREHGVPRYFSLTRNDHQLVFDTENEQDVLLFWETVKNAGSVVLKEFILEKDALVKGQQGHPFINQFLTCATSNQQVYRPYTFQLKKSDVAKRKFVPGSGWLYLKIYCHPNRSNEILSGYLVPAIAGTGKSREWFFVRYQDPSFHLRVRLKISPADAAHFLEKCNELLGNAVDGEQVEKIQTDTYVRELERYGERTIDITETLFYRSSVLVATFIKKFEEGRSRYNYYSFALVTVNEQVKILFPDETERLSFLQHTYKGFLAEYGRQRELKVSFDQLFRKFRKEFEAALKDQSYLSQLRLGSGFAAIRGSLKQLRKLTSKLPPAEHIARYRDILHMHMNRIFVQDSRKLELTTYYVLYKFTLGDQKARKRGH